MKFCALSSGSVGNCYYLELGTKKILVDLGLTKKRIEESLTEIFVDPSDITDVFLTHEHVDHVAAVGTWARAHACSLYATEGTWNEVFAKLKASQNTIPEASSLTVWCGEPFYLDDIYVEPIPTCHDAADSCGYAFRGEGKTVVILTDTGSLTERMAELMEEADVAVIESNHDISMLRNGPYPKALINRIEGCCGHLSNDTCARLLSTLSMNINKKRYIYLGHLSAENNTPLKALGCTFDALSAKLVMKADWDAGVLTAENGSVEVRVCHRGFRTEVLSL